MTTPTPEAIEAAVRALCTESNYTFHDEAIHDAKVALSAAYPLMEAQAKAEALREAADDLDPIVPDTNHYDAPLVGLTVSSCKDWLEALAAAIAPDVTP